MAGNANGRAGDTRSTKFVVRPRTSEAWGSTPHNLAVIRTCSTSEAEDEAEVDHAFRRRGGGLAVASVKSCEQDQDFANGSSCRRVPPDSRPRRGGALVADLRC